MQFNTQYTVHTAHLCTLPSREAGLWRMVVTRLLGGYPFPLQQGEPVLSLLQREGVTPAKCHCCCKEPLPVLVNHRSGGLHLLGKTTTPSYIFPDSCSRIFFDNYGINVESC